MEKQIKILILEDEPSTLELIQHTFHRAKDAKLQLFFVHTLKEALQTLHNSHFDLILLDLNIIDGHGIQTFREIHKKTSSTPSIVIETQPNEERGKELVRLGAQEYLSIDELNKNLLPRMHYAIERQKLHEELKALSFTDVLTGLYNRRGFIEFLKQHLSLSKRIKKGFYLFVMDLDFLKKINDSYGHIEGDHALVRVADCLRSCFRQHDVIGRIGGDEFAVIALSSSWESGELLKQNIHKQLKRLNTEKKGRYALSLSIGKVFFDGFKEASIEELLDFADQELYKEKKITHSQ
ncbi:MAG: hypothetical protein S4CHLAM123_15090 [Chlamydiales bacterium]|nr:hypothetical protein [Chlamydiales bacterium]